MRLYRLTNTDVTILEEELKNLTIIINELELILSNPEKLNNVIKTDLRRIKKEYGTKRLTTIQDEIEEIKLDTTLTIPKEDVVVVVSHDGYVKRVSKRSYLQVGSDLPLLKEDDYVIGIYNMNTLDTLLLFTDLGNYLYVPVYEIYEGKWKELGKHISNIVNIDSGENIISAMPVYDFNDNIFVTSFSKKGMVKRTKLCDFKVQRYSKAINMMKLKNDDKVVSVDYNQNSEVFIATRDGYGLWYDVDVISVTVVTDRGTAKRLKLSDFEKGSRANRGLLLMKIIKSNPSKIINVFIENTKNMINVKSIKETKLIKLNEIPIMDRYSNGSYIVKERVICAYKEALIMSKDDAYVVVKNNKENNVSKDKDPSLKEIDDRFMTIDDLLNNIK